MCCWAHSRFSGNITSMSSFAKTTKGLLTQQQVLLFCVFIESPQASHRPQASPASSKTSQSHYSLVGTYSASRGPGVPFAEIPFHPEKALSLGNLLFVIRRPEGSPNQWKLTEQIKRHKTPKELPGPLGSEARHCIYVQMEPD